MSGTLRLVGTPIGNLGDLSPRARAALASADLIACESVPRIRALLTHFEIPAPRLVTVNEGNERERVPEILGHLHAGRDVVLVSSAGMPSFSDPGYRLVRACVEAGLEVDVVPGPAAAVAALVVSGLPTDRFAFEGFLPRRGGARRARLEDLASERRTIVLFESPRRVGELLAEAASALGDRRAAVVRELTKANQEVIRATLAELAERFAADDPRGEVTIVVEGARPAEPDLASLGKRVEGLVGAGVPRREAAARVAAETGASRRELYEASLRTGEGSPDRSPGA